MTCYQRHVCGQALVMAGGWFSLRYGWGIEVQRWPVVLAFGASMAFGFAPLCWWATRGTDAKRKDAFVGRPVGKET